MEGFAKTTPGSLSTYRTGQMRRDQDQGTSPTGLNCQLSLFKFRAALWSEKNNRRSLSILDLSFHVSGLSSGPILWISFQALDEQSETDQESVLLSKTLSCWIWATGKTSFYNQKISLLIYSSSVNWSVKWSTHTRGLHTRLAALNSTDPFKTGSSIELWGSL